MKLPIEQVIIPREKLTQYLLVHRARSDKSQFLAQAGFTAGDPEQLDAALRQHVITIWVQSDGHPDQIRFVTLKPQAGA